MTDKSQASGNIQAGVLADVPQHGRYITFQLDTDAQSLKAAIEAAAEYVNDHEGVIGFGSALLHALEIKLDKSLVFPNFDHQGIQVPATPDDLWVWLRGSDPGELLHQSQQLEFILISSFAVVSCIDGFTFKEGRDLTGYVDGTENPVGDNAVAAAFNEDGSSFVAVQQWRHDLEYFASLKQQDKDHIIGRRLSDNVELDDAPASAHVKRTAQESFSPQAFMLRRSMPYSLGLEAGLMFVCFAHSPLPFKQQLARMVGKEDGVADGLFRFSRPLTGAYYWCPPIIEGKLSLSS